MEGTDIALPISSALACVFVYKSKFPSSLFSYHPALMGIGWLGLTPFAIRYIRRSKQEASEKRVALVKKHAITNMLVFAATCGGLYAIYRNKENMAASKGQVAVHLVSLHAKLGAVAGLLAGLSMGIAASKTTQSKSRVYNYQWRNKIHKFLGLLSYIVAGLSICVIANGPWGKHNLGSQAGQRVMIALIVACQAAVAMPVIFG